MRSSRARLDGAEVDGLRGQAEPVAAVLAVHEGAPLVDGGALLQRHGERGLRHHLPVGREGDRLVAGAAHRRRSVATISAYRCGVIASSSKSTAPVGASTASWPSSTHSDSTRSSGTAPTNVSIV